MGSLVKQWVKNKFGGRPIYHVTVMPCYDKKLEASREDFFDMESESRDVDCVVTSSKTKKSEIFLNVLFIDVFCFCLYVKLVSV